MFMMCCMCLPGYNFNFLRQLNLINKQENAGRFFKSREATLVAHDFDGFDAEIRRWRARCRVADNQASTISETLADINPELYPNVFLCLQVLLAMPVSTASAERSFSLMRRLKTYLRSIMSSGRMSSPGLMHTQHGNQCGTCDLYVRSSQEQPCVQLFCVSE